MTFREICEKVRERCAVAAWERACRASVLRHAAKDDGNLVSARRLGTIKASAIGRARALMPQAFRLRKHAEVVAIGTAGRGTLHLPARMLA